MIITLLEFLHADYRHVSHVNIGDSVINLPQGNLDKKTSKLWSPYHLVLGKDKIIGKRSFDLPPTLSTSLFVFDWDFNTTPELNFNHFRHKTHSGRWRIIIPLARSITIEPSKYKLTYFKVAKAVGLLNGKLKIDEHTSQMTSFFMLPPKNEKLEYIECDNGDLGEDKINSADLDDFEKSVIMNLCDLDDWSIGRIRSLHDSFKNMAAFSDVKFFISCPWTNCHDSKDSHYGDLSVNTPNYKNNQSANIFCYHSSCKANLIRELDASGRYRDMNKVSKNNDRADIDFRTLSYTELWFMYGILNKKWGLDWIERQYLPVDLVDKENDLRLLRNRPEIDASILDSILFDENIIYDLGETIDGVFYPGDLTYYMYNGVAYEPITETFIEDKLSGSIKAWYRYKFWSLAPSYSYAMTNHKNELLSYMRGRGMRDVKKISGLTLQNGILEFAKVGDLRNKKLEVTFRKHSKDKFLTHTLPYDYDPEATCPNWLELLRTYFGSNTDIVRMLGQFFGICLTDWRDYECFLLMYGVPRSGKGTICNALMRLVGGTPGHLKNLMTETGQAEIARYKVACFDEEFSNADKDLIAELKKLSSNDPLRCRTLWKTGVISNSFPKMVFAFNHVPRNFNGDDAMFARARVIQFNKSFVDCEDPDIKNEVIPSECSGILNWALSHLQDVVDNKGVMSVKSAVQKLKAEMPTREAQILYALDGKLPIGQRIYLDEIKTLLHMAALPQSLTNAPDLPTLLEGLLIKSRGNARKNKYTLDADYLYAYMEKHGIQSKLYIMVIKDNYLEYKMRTLLLEYKTLMGAERDHGVLLLFKDCVIYSSVQSADVVMKKNNKKLMAALISRYQNLKVESDKFENLSYPEGKVILGEFGIYHDWWGWDDEGAKVFMEAHPHLYYEYVDRMAINHRIAKREGDITCQTK